jgi:UDP-MurNAc hydroxylase
MQITFVTHAGFLTEVNGKTILTDPWTKGKAFNDSWALLSKPFDVDYSKVDYIFISHEHPDHFSFPSLKSIPEEQRKKIKILYQKHASKRLNEAFLKLSFHSVIELPLYKWSKVDGIDLFCGSAGSMDSFLAIKEGNQTLLNLNDCVFNRKQYEYIYNAIGKVDLLFTQFSFANWVGNDSDEVGNAAKKIEDIRIQLEIFKPKYAVPFASFVYFCNAENARMNEWINTPAYIESMNLPETNFMYPGDSVDLGNPQFSSKQAVAKFMADLASIKIDPTPPAKSFEEIKDAVNNNLSDFTQRIYTPFRNLVKPFSIYITDLNKAIEVDAAKGVMKELPTGTKCRYEMCSQVCWFTFKFSWGAGTLDVSGMYRDNEYPAPQSKYFFFQNLLSTEYLSAKNLLPSIQFLWQKKWEIAYRYI